MKVRVLAIAAIVVIMTASMAAAQSMRETSRALAWDLSIETRYAGSQDYSGNNNTSLELDDDLGWGFGFGYNMNERFSLGMLFSWRSVNYKATYENATDPAVVTDSYGGELDTGTFAAMGQWNILPKSFTPYVNGGIGWTLIDTNIVADYQTGCWYDPWWGYVCSGYTSTYGTDCASFALGAGLRFEPNETVFIQVGYEMDWLDLDNVDSFDIFRVDVGFTNK